ncbi:HAD domain-containing protein [Thiomonas sp.]
MTTKSRDAVLFLDFDGVLHALDGAEDFRHVPLLATVIAPHAVDLVITSSWKIGYALDEMVERLGPVLGARVVGITPEVRPFASGYRQREVEAWQEASHRRTAHWLALDDDPQLFDPDCPNLLLCDGRTGFTEQDALKLTDWLKMAR